MKCLRRNKQPFYYALYWCEDPGYDTEGNQTGEPEILYRSPVKCFGNISPATGLTSVEQFGNSLQYDKVIVLDDPKCPIDESTILFIDKEPDANLQYDYVVKKVARSLNSVSIAIAKVEVS